MDINYSNTKTSKTSKISPFFLASILLFNSTASLANLLIGPELDKYSAIAGAAMGVGAQAVVSDNIAARDAISVSANTQTADLFSVNAAVDTGDGGSHGDIYAGAAAGIGANGTAGSVYAVDALVLGANGVMQDGYSGAAVSLAAGSGSEDIFSTGAITGIGSDSQTSNFDTSPVIESIASTFDIDVAMDEIANAQAILYDVDTDFTLSAGMGNVALEEGVYDGTALTITAGSVIQFDGQGEENPLWIINLDAALTVGANTTIEIINAGSGAGVIWNIGGAVTLGAGSSFLGTAFVAGAISGATSQVSCGNLFSTAAIGIGSLISTNCAATDSWDGSVGGLANNLVITDQGAKNDPEAANNFRRPNVSAVPELDAATAPLSVLLLSGLLAAGFERRRKITLK
jgi:hypothetical protein